MKPEQKPEEQITGFVFKTDRGEFLRFHRPPNERMEIVRGLDAATVFVSHEEALNELQLHVFRHHTYCTDITLEAVVQRTVVHTTTETTTRRLA